MFLLRSIFFTIYQILTTKYLLLFLLIIFILDRYFKDFSNLDKTINYNFSFSLKIFQGTYFIPIFLILLFFIFYIQYSKFINKHKYPIFIILTGGLSNLIDRYIYGGVVDYLDFFGLLKNNIADYLIILGLILLIVGLFLKKENIK